MEAEPPKAEPPKRKRRWFQFSLRTLLLFIVAASLALAAMRYSTSAWATGAVTLTVIILLFSAAIGASSSGDRRAFWIGFAICGSGYLVVTMSFVPEFVERLATSQAVAFLRDRFHPPSEFQSQPTLAPDTPAALMPSQLGIVPGSSIPLWLIDFGEDYKMMSAHFVLIGQCTWALILATVGGMLTQFFGGRRWGIRA